MVAYNNRVLAVGSTRAGKSELLNVLFSGLRCQRLMVDPKDEFAIADVPRVHSVDELDWEQEVLHLVPGPDMSPEAWERLWQTVYGRRRLTVLVHEAAYTVGFRAGRAGPYLNSVLAQGEAHGIGWWGATTRPVNNPAYAYSEPGHVFAFVPRPSRADDLATLAGAVDLSPQELADELALLQGRYGERAFLWFNRRTGELSSWAPLPDHLRAQSIVTRRTVE